MYFEQIFSFLYEWLDVQVFPDKAYNSCISDVMVTRGPFFERPSNLTNPKSYFEIKFSRKVGCVLTSNEVHFVSLADNFTVQFSNHLKLLSRRKNKTA